MFDRIRGQFAAASHSERDVKSLRAHKLWWSRKFLDGHPTFVLWLACCVIVCSVLGLFGVEICSRYLSTISNAERVAQSFADVLAEHTARTFEAVERTLRVAASIRNDTVAGRLSNNAANEALRSLRANSPALLAVGWTNELGDVVAHSYDGAAVPANIADLPHFRAQKDGNNIGLFIAPLYRSDASKRWISAASLRVNNSDGSFAGVVTAPLDLSYFARIYRSINLGANDAVTLVQHDGKILTREPFLETIAGQSYGSTKLFTQYLPRSEFGVFEAISPIDQANRLFAYRSVAGLPLVMIVLQDRADVLAEWYDHLRTFAPMVALLIVIIVAGTSVLAQRTRQLFQKTALLNATLDNMHQGLIVVDHTDRIAIYNKSALQLLDLPEALLGAHPLSEEVIAFQAANGEFTDVGDSVMNRILPQTTGETENVYERLRPNGTTLEVRTVPFFSGGVVRTYKDITEWKRIERELSDGKKKYKLLAENVTDIIARLNFEGKLLYLSPSCHAILGYSPEQLVGEKITDYICKEDVKSTVALFAELGKGAQNGKRRVEYRFRHKSGHFVWLEANPRLITDENGMPLEFVDVVRETTQRKAIEAEAHEAREMAERSAASQAQFLASMSHELRTPLNSIIGFSDIILRRGDLAVDLRRQMELSHMASDSLLAVVNDVLDYSKMEEGKFEICPIVFDMRAMIYAVISIVEQSADEKQLEMRVSIDADVAVRLVGDDQRIRQILFNLINNAIKFTRAGFVSLNVELIDYDATTQKLRFSVSDSGIGIPESKMAKLFQRFSQIDGSTSRHYGGSGLGLAICKRLAELMSGEVGVESALGIGSTFWITLELPVAAANQSAMKLSVLPTVTPASLLLVEDVEVNREIACAVLEDLGYRVHAVADGFDAVLAVQNDVYDLVLMDVQMPGMDGVTATALIRALGGKASRIPIVAMTANVLPGQIQSFKSAGMDGHVGKPFKREALGAEIERCLAEAEIVVCTDIVLEAAPILDHQTIKTMTDLLGSAKVEHLLCGLRLQLESFLSFEDHETSTKDIAAQAHRLVSSAGMLGFSNVSKLSSRYEMGLRGIEPQAVSFEQVSDACRDALTEMLRRADSDQENADFTVTYRPSDDATSIGMPLTVFTA